MDAVDVALRVADALERVGVGYFLGGSFASSMQGEPRATNDVDLVVDLAEEQVDRLVAALGPYFDADPAALRRAAREGGSWNVFHLPVPFTKVDLFVLGRGAFDASEFARRTAVEVRPGRRLFVKTPEDTVLRKLLWYRHGGGTSERQWRDVVEVLRVSGPALDGAYLASWAGALGVTRLLEKALAEAGRPGGEP